MTNKVAIITGSAAGLGAAVARQLAAKNYNVVINYSRSEDAARETEAECAKAGAETLLVQADMGEDADCRKLAAATMEKWGRIDALVNNAGYTKFIPHTNLEELTVEDFDKIMRVNVTGVYAMTRAAAPHLKASGDGSVVNISSIAGILGNGSCVAYAASKAALNMMTVSLARVLAPEVRCNAVCPGFIGTRWQVAGQGGQESYDAYVKQVEQGTPLKRANTPDDIAETVVWFVDGGRWITGETLMVDSGTHL